MVGFVYSYMKMGLGTPEFAFRALWYVYHNQYAIIKDGDFLEPQCLHLET